MKKLILLLLVMVTMASCGVYHPSHHHRTSRGPGRTIIITRPLVPFKYRAPKPTYRRPTHPPRKGRYQYTNPLDWGFFILYLCVMRQLFIILMIFFNALVLATYCVTEKHIEPYRWFFTIFFLGFFSWRYKTEFKDKP